MKILIYIFVLCTFISCNKQKINGGDCLPFNEEVVISYGQLCSNTAEQISLQFIEVVSDSRCPGVVDCFWAGDGHIRLEFKTGSTGHIIDLHTELSPKDTIIDSYHIVLIKLDPYPHEDNVIPSDEYRATVLVKKE